MEQERLLIEAAQKDPSRFAALYENNFERVYAFVVRRVRDRHEAEDLTAEVFQHALANLLRFEWRGVPFAVWLYRIAGSNSRGRARTPFPTTSIRRPGPTSNAEPRCFNWLIVFPSISAPSSSNVSSSKGVFAILRWNSAGPRARSSSFSTGRWRVCERVQVVANE